MFKSVIKKNLKNTLALFNKDYLLEYFQIKRAEKKVLAPITAFYSGFIFQGMKIIDVGVNVGSYSQAFLSMGAKVIGLEPQKYCQQILSKRFKNESRFKLIPSASGASLSVGEIHKTHSHTIASMNADWIDSVKKSDRFKGENWNTKERISITTLDQVIKENFIPDYIKIDVEGFEKEVLKGLNQPVNFISFEITLPEMTKQAIDCIEEVDRLGNYVYVIPEQVLSKINTWYSKKEILEQLQGLGAGTAKVSSDIFCKRLIS